MVDWVGLVEFVKILECSLSVYGYSGSVVVLEAATDVIIRQVTHLLAVLVSELAVH